jgi:Na+:H+ antiporter, NhaA family
MSQTPNLPLRERLFRPGSWAEARRIGEILRTETVGGGLLVVAAVAAVALANSPLAPAYFGLRDLAVGPESLGLHLTLGAWASDGLLAIFFFLVGLELKQEFVAGDLSDPRKAMVPVLAAVGGVITPALIYAAVNLTDPARLRGWAIPTATDIAFALAVLALIGSHLPGALRTFLLTLAVVDDLITIAIMAFVYASHFDVPLLIGAAAAIGLYAFVVHRFRPFVGRRWAGWVVLLPLGIVTWVLLHAGGIHPTIAGVALGLVVPAVHSSGDDRPGLAAVLEHRLRPLSTGLAVPAFAFLNTGVAVGGLSGLWVALASPITLGILAARVIGKPVGIVATTWLVTKVTDAELDDSVSWIDLAGVGILAGLGFTVPLLVSELSFGTGSVGESQAKVGILAACVVAAALAALALVPRNRRYREIERRQSLDTNADGTPDAYQP